MASKKPEKKSAPTKPTAPVAGTVPPPTKGKAKTSTTTGRVHVEIKESRTEVIQADFYQISIKTDALAQLRESSDAPKRQETIARKMRLQPGVDVPHKGDIGHAFDQDFETIWRHVEGLDMRGSRGPTIEDVTRSGD